MTFTKLGDQAFNKVPDNCIIGLDIRFVPEEMETIKENIQQLLPKDFSFDVIAYEPAMLTNESGEFIKQLEKNTQNIIGKAVRLRGAHGSSDARHFARVNGLGVEFGPIGGGIGSDDEWVDISSLEKYYQILKAFLLTVKADKEE